MRQTFDRAPQTTINVPNGTSLFTMKTVAAFEPLSPWKLLAARSQTAVPRILYWPGLTYRGTQVLVAWGEREPERVVCPANRLSYIA